MRCCLCCWQKERRFDSRRGHLPRLIRLCSMLPALAPLRLLLPLDPRSVAPAWALAALLSTALTRACLACRTPSG